jgi:EmrB/QacA subfamily drug resistance transporter
VTTRSPGPPEVGERAGPLHPAGAGGGRQHYGLTLAVLVLAAMAYALSQTLVAPALPEIQRELGTSTTTVTFVLTGYLLSASVATPIVGRLGDMFGKERMLVLTLLAFGAGSLVAALAPTIEVLIAGRAVQGLGGAVFPLAFGIIRDEFPREKVATGIGLISATFGIGGGAGLILSGVIVDHLSYRWIFWLGLIVVAIAVVAAHLFVPESPVKTPARIDWVGAGLLAGGLVAILIAVSEGNRWGWTSARIIWLFAAGAALLLVLVGFELRHPQPLIDMRMLARPAVLAPNLTGLMVGFGMFGSFILIPQLVQLPPETGYGFGASVTGAGLFLLPSTLAMLIAGPFAGWLGARAGAKIPLLVGTFLALGAYTFLAVEHSERWSIYTGTAVLGLGIGFSFAAMANLIVEAVDQTQTGVATGINTIMRTIGGTLGGQIAASLVAGHSAPTGLPEETGFTNAFIMSALGLALATMCAFTIPTRRVRPTHAGSRPNAAAAAPPAGFGAPAPGRAFAAAPPGTLGAPAPARPAVQGRLLHLQAHPLAGAAVTVRDATGRQVAHTVAAADGTYGVHLDAAGTYTVHVEGIAGTGSATLARTLTVEVDDEPTTLDVSLPGQADGVRGQVRTAYDLPVPDAVLVVLDMSGHTVRRARTDPTGRYELAQLPTGTHTLLVIAPGMAPLTCTLTIPFPDLPTLDLALLGHP